VAAAQNVLMKKLGISSEPQLDAADFERYISIFENGFTDEQIMLIRELFQADDAPLAGALADQEAT
jgi:hypothetical protein